MIEVSPELWPYELALRPTLISALQWNQSCTLRRDLASVGTYLAWVIRLVLLRPASRADCAGRMRVRQASDSELWLLEGVASVGVDAELISRARAGVANVQTKGDALLVLSVDT